MLVISVAASVKPSWLADLATALAICGRNGFTALLTPFKIAIVPSLSNTTSAAPEIADTDISFHRGMLTISASASICASMLSLSSSVNVPETKSFLLASILSAAAYSCVASSAALLPYPLAKNKGIAAGPVKAIVNEGMACTAVLPAQLISVLGLDKSISSKATPCDSLPFSFSAPCSISLASCSAVFIPASNASPMPTPGVIAAAFAAPSALVIW